MSRPHITDAVVDGLNFARSCVLDQQAASQGRNYHAWDARYVAALDSLDTLMRSHRARTRESSGTSRPNVTDTVVAGLKLARACVRDQRTASHAREDHSWDARYTAALDAIDVIERAHARSVKRIAGQAP